MNRIYRIYHMYILLGQWWNWLPCIRMRLTHFLTKPQKGTWSRAGWTANWGLFYSNKVRFRFTVSVRLLTVMRLPCTLRDLHICEYRFKTGVLRTAGINSESYLTCSFPHMAYSHLGEILTILGAFDTIIIFASAKSVPHRLNICRDSSSCPVRITMIGYNRVSFFQNS